MTFNLFIKIKEGAELPAAREEVEGKFGPVSRREGGWKNIAGRRQKMSADCKSIMAGNFSFFPFMPS